MFEPQASFRLDRFLACQQGEAEGLQGGARFLWFISLRVQRKNLPPGNPGLHGLQTTRLKSVGDCRHAIGCQ